uniref:Uncharacterized protein n=1 Tax=Anguilla anguilla TaxID=7936 RepID=A0A0E9XR34_ANGAN
MHTVPIYKLEIKEEKHCKLIKKICIKCSSLIKCTNFH